MLLPSLLLPATYLYAALCDVFPIHEWLATDAKTLLYKTHQPSLPLGTVRYLLAIFTLFSWLASCLYFRFIHRQFYSDSFMLVLGSLRRSYESGLQGKAVLRA